MELTEQQAKQYVESDGVRCPFCGSDDIEGESITVDAGRVYQRVLCQVCGESWHDGYTLDSVADDSCDTEFHYPILDKEPQPSGGAPTDQGSKG